MCRMRTANPVAQLFSLRVAAEANAIAFIRGTLREGHNLGNISAAVYVKAAVGMALFAFDS